MEIMTTAMTLAMKTATELVISSSEPMQHKTAVLTALDDLKAQLGVVCTELETIKEQSKAQGAQLVDLMVELKAMNVSLAGARAEAAKEVVAARKRSVWKSCCLFHLQILAPHQSQARLNNQLRTCFQALR